jgi:predicted nucleic acid-binding protein
MASLTRISLDTNIFILGIRNIEPYSVAILKNLFQFDVFISAQVEKELRNNISSSELKEFFSLIDPLSHFEIVYQEPEQGIFENFQQLGLKTGDALIAAFCNSENVEIMISENRHFLQQLQKRPFEILDSASFCIRFGLGA